MARPVKLLTREDIERAMHATLSNRAAARYLHVSYPHYKRYAELYKDENGISLYQKHFNRGGKGIPKFALTDKNSRRSKEPPITEILEGRVSASHFSTQALKYKLIALGFLAPKCNRCGFDKVRVLDGKSPLLLIHKDGNKNNWNLENLEFICYNCAFLEGPNSIITDEMVEKSEDCVDRNGAKITDETWELDDYQKAYLENLLKDERPNPGSEYISRF